MKFLEIIARDCPGVFTHSGPEADLWSKRVITISRKVDSLQIVVNINDVSGK
jgi:hypothetical protein